MKNVIPTISETAFNCPYCGAFTQQIWHELCTRKIDNRSVPYIWREQDVVELESQMEQFGEVTTQGCVAHAKQAVLGDLFTAKFSGTRDALSLFVNLSASQCYNCNKHSLWVYDRLIYPKTGSASPVNPDTPEDIRKDYEEASVIFDQSPRGAAALLRLGIQKLCKHLGQSGKNLNSDIQALVTQGLDPRVQKALDAVRVIGNESVHPGQIDLRDDPETASALFQLFNIIVERTISYDKHVDDVFNRLPESKKVEIAMRDKKK